MERDGFGKDSGRLRMGAKYVHRLKAFGLVA